jgi:hypothetical protein
MACREFISRLRWGALAASRACHWAREPVRREAAKLWCHFLRSTIDRRLFDDAKKILFPKIDRRLDADTVEVGFEPIVGARSPHLAKARQKKSQSAFSLLDQDNSLIRSAASIR